MKNFLRSIRTTLAGAIFGGGFIGQAAYSFLNGGHFDTKQILGGVALIVLGTLAKDANVEGVAPVSAE
jgi:hypothetical protein